MGDSESISVVSEGSAVANAHGSIVGDHEATGSGATEVWSRRWRFSSLSLFRVHCYFVKVTVFFGHKSPFFPLISGPNLLRCNGQRGM